MKEIFLFASVFLLWSLSLDVIDSKEIVQSLPSPGKMTMKNEITNKRTHQSECSRWQFGSRKRLVPVFRAVSGEY